MRRPTRSSARRRSATSAGIFPTPIRRGRTRRASTCCGARSRWCARGLRVVNLDVVVVLERPKIAPFSSDPRRARRVLGGAGRSGQRQGQDQRRRRRRRPRRGDRRPCRRDAGGAPRTDAAANDASPLRSQPDRSVARRQRADGAVQLAARARPRRHDSSCASRTPTPSDRRASPKTSILEDLRWLGLRLGRRARRRRCRTARIGNPSGCTCTLVRERADRRRARVLLLLLAAKLEADRQDGSRLRPAAALRRHLPRAAASSRRARGSRRASGRSSASACRRTEVSVQDLVRGEVTFSTEVIGDPVLVRSDGAPGLQLRRRRRRCADGDHARDSRRGPHFEHAAAGAALSRRSASRRRSSRTCRW